MKNHEIFRAYKAQMSEDQDEVMRLMGKLTCLHLQDIIAWMVAVG